MGRRGGMVLAGSSMVACGLTAMIAAAVVVVVVVVVASGGGIV